MSATGRLSTLAALVVAVVLLAPAPLAQAATPAATQATTQAATRAGAPWPGHPGRVLVTHKVKPGNTATGLSVRYHAWTREFIALNGSKLRVGQTVRIPVVVAAVRRAKKARANKHKSAPATTKHQSPRPPAKKATKKKVVKKKSHSSSSSAGVIRHATRPPGHGWLHADLSREQVRRLVVATAKSYGVPPKLALAIAWQESGWQQRRVSSAGALGVMQVMPGTGRWMELYVGRKLRLRDSHDNVLAGVRTIKVLLDSTKRDNRAVAAYYQGLGAVRNHGLYSDTKRYVAAVRAHESRIARTGSPV